MKPDKLTIYVAGIEKGIVVELDGRSSHDEWENLKALTGRWGDGWIEVAKADTTTTYVRGDAIVKVEVNYTPPPSPEVAEKTALEAANAAERKRVGIDKPPYTDQPKR